MGEKRKERGEHLGEKWKGEKGLAGWFQAMRNILIWNAMTIWAVFSGYRGLYG